MKLLVTLDGSEFSEAIMEPAVTLARGLNAEVHLLAVGRNDLAHETPRKIVYPEVVPAATPSGTTLKVPLMHQVMPGIAETRGQVLERIEAALSRYLTGKAQAFAGLQTSVHVDVADEPAQAIMDYAQRHHIDMIAMATHGRTGLSHLLAGSVCEKVVRSGIAPVLVLRPTI
jgi:nucleotide-binding universal stress UspA family protein